MVGVQLAFRSSPQGHRGMHRGAIQRRGASQYRAKQKVTAQRVDMTLAVPEYIERVIYINPFIYECSTFGILLYEKEIVYRLYIS